MRCVFLLMWWKHTIVLGQKCESQSLTYLQRANIDSGTAGRLCQRSPHEDRVCFQKHEYFDYTCSVSLSEVSMAMISP